MIFPVPKWKKVLSYISDVKLKTILSDTNGEMQLYLSSGEFKLTTKNTIYSFGKKYASFGNAFQKINIYNKEIKSVCVLGWGIGSISTLLEQNNNIHSILGVEHDEALVKFYNEFKPNYSKRKVAVIQQDANQFVANSLSKFDLVCSDIFMDHVTPPFIVSETYILGLNKMLNTKGIAMISKLNRSVTDVQQNKILENILEKHIGEFNCIKTLGNSVYWWQKP